MKNPHYEKVSIEDRDEEIVWLKECRDCEAFEEDGHKDGCVFKVRGRAARHSSEEDGHKNGLFLQR